MPDQTNPIYNQLKAYLDQQASQDEQLQLLEQYTRDPEFAQEIREWLSVKTAIDQYGDNYYRAIFREENTKIKAAQHQRRRRRNWILGGIAATIIGILFWVWIEPTLHVISTDSLYASYYETPPLDQVRTTANSLWKHAYSSRNFSEVYQQLNSQDSLMAREQFYLGISYMETGQYKEAAQTLLAVDSLSYFSLDVSWFLALIKLKENQLTNCSAYLKQIQKSPSPKWKSKATALLEEIEQLP